MASMQVLCRAPANFSLSVLTPRIDRHGHDVLGEVAVDAEHARTSSWASSWLAWAVCPSCHRNSVVRRNMRVRFSQRMTLAHWFTSSGRSR
jgi:hypothetical protein